MPSGNRITCSVNAFGSASYTGRCSTTVVSPSAAAKRPKAGQSFTWSSNTNTARTAAAGATISFALTTSASTSPLSPARPVAASAQESTSRPTMARSGPATAQVNAVSGQASASCAARTGTWGQRRSFSAPRTQPDAASANIQRASVSALASDDPPKIAPGNPKLASTGPYGVQSFTTGARPS